MSGIEKPAALAAEFNIAEKSVADWLSGKTDRFTMDHGIWHALQIKEQMAKTAMDEIMRFGGGKS